MSQFPGKCGDETESSSHGQGSDRRERRNAGDFQVVCKERLKRRM